MTRESTHAPHDRIAKIVLRREAATRALLAFALPRPWPEILDRSTFVYSPSEIIGADLSLGVADLVIGITEQASSSAEVFAFLLIEHLSEPDPFAITELFCDVGRLWSAWRRSHPRDRTIPHVLPIVFHNGPKGWKGPRHIVDTLKHRTDGGSLRDLGPATLPTTWIDLAGLPNSLFANIAEFDPFSGAALSLMRWSRTQHAFERLLEISAWLGRVLLGPGGDSALSQLIRYYLSTNERSHRRGVAVGVDRVLADLILRLPSPAEQLMHTLADELIDRGIEKGIERGIEKGIERGIERGIEKGIETVLLARFGRVPESILERLRAKGCVESLQKHLARAATCSSLEEFDRGLSQ